MPANVFCAAATLSFPCTRRRKLGTEKISEHGGFSENDEKEKGSLLEQTYNGEKPLKIKGEIRTFIENGDTVSLSGYAEKNGVKVGFGQAIGTLKKRKKNE